MLYQVPGLNRFEVNLVDDWERDLFDRFVERKDEFKLMIIRLQRRTMLRRLTYDVLAASGTH